MRNVLNLKLILDDFYEKYNRREFVSPDPLEFLYRYKNIRDREIAGLVASTLAYGNVKQILKSVETILSCLTPSPHDFLKKTSKKEIGGMFRNFKHRFTTGIHITHLLIGIKTAIEEYGSLKNCFLSGFGKSDATIIPAISAFAGRFPNSRFPLLPSPDQGSACKRLNLFLRWVIRKDAVDPGGWEEVPLSKAIIPLDTHMHRISLALGLTKRKQADLKTALEVTSAFASLVPEDPVKYDFCLTRFGIRDDLDLHDLLKPFASV